jgi:hypothetical protein
MGFGGHDPADNARVMLLIDLAIEQPLRGASTVVALQRSVLIRPGSPIRHARLPPGSLGWGSGYAGRTRRQRRLSDPTRPAHTARPRSCRSRPSSRRHTRGRRSHRAGSDRRECRCKGASFNFSNFVLRARLAWIYEADFFAIFFATAAAIAIVEAVRRTV